LTLSADQVLDTIVGPQLIGRGTPAIAGTTNIRFDSLATVVANQNINFDGMGSAGDNADYVALRNAIVAVVQRQFAPFDVVVATSAAASAADVPSTMGANNGASNGRFDAYVLVTGAIRTDTSEAVGDDTDLLGISSGRDLADQQNTRDESVLVFADNFGGYG